jgi:hypothetical protein
MLRHICFTNKYKNIPALSKMEQLSEDMGDKVLNRQWNILRDNVFLGRILSVFLLHR